MPKEFTSTTFSDVYKDDYRDSDNYHRILFNSGRPLQARELTQLQTILQNQIQRFADNIFLEGAGVKITRVNKVQEGRPDVRDAIRNRQVQLVINTTSGAKAISDSKSLRLATLTNKIPYFTTLAGAASAADAIIALIAGNLEVKPLQDYFK